MMNSETDFPEILIDNQIDNIMIPPDIDEYLDTNIGDEMDDNIVNKSEKKLQTALSKMPFVVERPFSCFIGSSSIEDVMKCPSKRLNFIDASYIIPQYSSGVQLTVIKQLNLPHGHVKELEGYLDLCQLKKTRIFHVSESNELLDTDHDEGFVQFVTLDEEMNVYWQKTFRKIGATLFSNYIQDYPMDPTINTSGDRQIINSDYGFAINRNTGRKPSDDVVNGITRPRLLKGTDDPFIKELFTKMSQVLNSKCKWIWPMATERRNQFSRRIAPSNIIEAMRLAINPIWIDDFNQLVDFLCNWHTDPHNDTKYPHVVVLSGVIWLIPDKLAARVTIIAYTRESGTNFLDRMDFVGEAVAHVYKVYEKIPLWRRSSTELLDRISRRRNTGVTPLGTKYWTLECHVNPLVYVGPWVHYVCVLTYKYGLNVVEVLSLIRAAATSAYTPYFFAVVAEDRMKYGFDKSQRGPLLGYHFSLEMLKNELNWKEIMKDREDTKIPGLHYQVNRDKSDRIESQWIVEVEEMLKESLLSWKDDRIMTNSSFRRKAYAKLFKTTITKWKKFLVWGGITYC